VTAAFAWIGAYVVLTGIASCAEKPVGGRVDAFQLNLAIRSGVFVLGASALLLTPGPEVPSGASLLAALAIGLIAGTGSICYCYAVDHLPVWLVVSVANAYILVTVGLGIALLHEPAGGFTLLGLVLTVAGVLLLSVTPRAGVSSPDNGATHPGPNLFPYAVLAADVLLVGVATFLEKPALGHGLTPLQLNALSAAGTLGVAAAALAARREPIQLGRSQAAGVGLGGMFGLAGIAYFLGLRDLPVSVAATTSNSYVVLTVILSAIVLHEPLTWKRAGAMLLTLSGVAVLAALGG
jgi:drug/metabolite transporter (DMT)-like permease